MLTSPDIQKFEERGLDPETAAKLGATFQNGRFTFDYLKDGASLFRKVRTVDKKFYIEPSGQRLQFWNLDSLRESHGLLQGKLCPLVITEGEFDAIAVAQSVGGYVVSVPNGVAGKRSEGDIVIAEDNRFSYLWEGEKLLPEIEQFDRIILCTDGDEPGMILRDELALRIGEARCWYVDYPAGAKDANDVLKIHGEQGVRDLIARARPMRPGYLVRPSEIPPRALSITYSSGWGDLDANLMIERPELIVVTGQPNHGKGQFIRCLAFNLAAAHGWRTAFLAQEDPAHRVNRDMRRYAIKRLGLPSADANQWVDEHFRISQMPEDEPVTLEMVENEMTSAAIHHDCQVFVLDPWNEVEHRFNKGENETQYIERALRQLLRKMRRLNLVLIIAAHPTKIEEGQKANLYKISGSANWKNKCQHGIVVHRTDAHSNQVEIIVEKSKDWETMGKPGKVFLDFDRDVCDYIFVSKG